MEYAVFPVFSNDVLIEDCVASGISDAALYVGQSTNIVVRNNEVFGNVAGIEIENSANAEVHDNHAYDNTGGILVFKLAGLPVQLSQCHDIHDNLIENNNGDNYGSGIVGVVPPGTGILILANDASVVHNNTLTGNRTFGIALSDQLIVNALFSPPPFPTPSPDPFAEQNYFIGNTATGNGLDSELGAALGADMLAITANADGTVNCLSGNTFTKVVQAPALAATCPMPPDPPGCPFSTTTSTTVTSTTNTTMTTISTTTTMSPSSTTSTTVLAYSWAQVFNVLNTNCSAGTCHGNGGASAGLSGLHDSNTACANLVNVQSTEVAPDPPGMLRVDPFYPLESYLMHKLDGTHLALTGSSVEGIATGTGGQMPQGLPGGLPLATRDGIRGWIFFGAQCP
jgi:parallel beta-helix repeat protein